ncbi:hypothetical protein [Sorangium sp. So ce693]|uniref:hypothetical protein n=1 Tax=Sorangium sp. So ce693 TaxID=3133318 RepID=UPI003F64507E
MSARTVRVGLVERFSHHELVDQLDLRPGVNVVVGSKDTGKTGWLRTISFLLGDTDGPEGALGAGIAGKFDSARLRLHIGPDEEVVLERRWKEAGAKHKVFINGDGIASGGFSEWMQKKLGVPLVRFPRGNPYSGATWPELSWRMLFRHVYREERFWADLADKQPEREQHACLLQFLGAAKRLYPEELGEEIRLRQDLLRLRARRDQFEDVLQQAAKGLLTDPSLSNAVTRDSISAGIERLRAEVERLGRQREEILADAITPKAGSSPQGLDLDLQLAEQRVSLIAEHERVAGALAAIAKRLGELATYRANISAELTRIKRVAVAEEVFRPLSVTRCPHCDQKVSPAGVAPGTCFVCHQHLAWEPTSGGRGATRRLAFEHEQLEGETEELDDLVKRLQSEQSELTHVLRRLDASLSEIDVRLRPVRAALAAAPPVGLEATATRVGQVEERIAQLLRLQETLDQRDKLTEQIDTLEAKAQTTGAHVEEKSAGVEFEKMSQELTDGINEYLNLLNEGDAGRWMHEPLRFRINDRSFKLLVGEATWSSVGATSVGMVLLAYHYALLKLSGREDRNYPGLALIDFPMTLADGTSIANKENYLVEPFVALAKANAATQSIICGRSFKGLKGAHRIQLSEVWTQGVVPALTFEALPPAGPRELDLTVAAHFHSRQEQVMMVLDPAEVARLAKLLPDLGAAIAAGRSWPGKDVTVRWSGGTYVTKLVHHIDNGNVKFTVRKREAKRLWDYLDELLRGTNPERDFAARYSLGTQGVLDEFFVDFRMNSPTI